jgi:hypothetical protein
MLFKEIDDEIRKLSLDVITEAPLFEGFSLGDEWIRLVARSINAQVK